MKKAIGIAIVSLLLLSGVAASAEVWAIQDFRVVTDFPDSMTAGATYEAHYTFRSTHSVPIQANLSVSHPLINEGEWFVTVMLDGDEINCTEVSTGNFSMEECQIGTGEHDLRINVSSLLNILPDTYDITMELWSSKVTVYPPSTGGGGRRRATPTPTPSPTPTPTATPTVTPTPTITPTPTPTPTLMEEEEPGFEAVFAILGLLAVAYWRRKI